MARQRTRLSADLPLNTHHAFGIRFNYAEWLAGIKLRPVTIAVEGKEQWEMHISDSASRLVVVRENKEFIALLYSSGAES